MRLTRLLGGMTVEEMLERISSIELVKWRAFFELEAEEEKFNQGKVDMMQSLRNRPRY